MTFDYDILIQREKDDPRWYWKCGRGLGCCSSLADCLREVQEWVKEQEKLSNFKVRSPLPGEEVTKLTLPEIKEKVAEEKEANANE